ncbi:MAG: sialate O-acetylesterase [Phycisphaerae bacterium]|jgi:alpha-galactosidase|nr:sialate O-acetylesterase [Phycisphaerae bacterium]
MKITRFTATVCLVLIAVVTIAVPAQAAPKAKGPVKVFILAGQSNMEGKAAPSTLEPVLADPKEGPKFKHLKKDGKWTVRDDVWVTFLSKSSKGPADDSPLYGPLTVHFGSDKNVRDAKGKRTKVAGFGPELGVGHVLGDKFDQQVLLIKTAWGGRSVKRTFRPPSAMPDEAEVKEALEQAKVKNPDAKLSEIKDSYGRDYRAMVAEVRKVTGDIKKYFPMYDETQGFELAGFIWFQGWNDGCGRGNPKYTEQLAALIRDLRKDLKTPKLSVVIGELGIDGEKPMGWIETFRKQQAAVAALPEFKGNVVLAKTAGFWPPWYKPLDDKWRAFKAKEKAWKAKLSAEAKKPTRDEINKFGDENWRNPNKETIARMSDKRYHYMGCGRTYYLMGESMGKAMLELLKK